MAVLESRSAQNKIKKSCNATRLGIVNDHVEQKKSDAFGRKTTMTDRTMETRIQESSNMCKDNEETTTPTVSVINPNYHVSQNAGIEKVPPSPKETSLRGYRNRIILHKFLVYAL
jgi:F420-0:gamma-glutamyl ligase